MNSRERILTALKRGTPDRVPISPHWGPGITSMVVRDAWRQMRGGWEHWRPMYEAHSQTGCDPFNMFGEPIDFDVEWKDGWGFWQQTLEHGRDHWLVEKMMETPVGRLTQHIRMDLIGTWELDYMVKTPEEWKIWQAYQEEWNRIAEPNTTRFDAAVEEVGDNGLMAFHLNTSWCDLGLLRGLDRLIVDFFRHPDLMAEVFETMRSYKRKLLDFFNQSKGEVIQVNPYWTCDSSPTLFKKWAIPEIKEDIKLAKKGTYFNAYFCGKMRHCVKDVVDAGVHCIEEFSPTEMGGDLSLEEGKKKYGGRVCLMGGFNVLILPAATPRQVEAEVKRCMDAAKEGGGYIFGTTDQMPPDSKIENIKTMIEAAKKYGQY